MKRFALAVAGAGLAALIAGPAWATHNGFEHTPGNGAPNGAHYNLNIIGVDKGKNSDMTGSNRHTIFVPLYSGKSPNNDGNLIPDTKIWLEAGVDFQVCDGNGFDEAFDCDGNQLNNKAGATFQLPCNTNITQGGNDKNGDPIDNTINCDEDLLAAGFVASYEVWARALGSPKNSPSAEIQTCATVTDEEGTEQICSTENTVLTRNKGKSTFEEVTDELTSIVVLLCVEVVNNVCTDFELTRIALFSGDTEDWFWGYTNNGLRLAQVRFYPTE